MANRRTRKMAKKVNRLPTSYQGRAKNERLQGSKRVVFIRNMLFCLLLLLVISGDCMARKQALCHEKQQWQIVTRIVSENGLIWEVEE